MGRVVHRQDNGLFAIWKTGSPRPTKQRYWPRWSLVKKKAEDAHRLVLENGPVWTLVWGEPKRRKWGFHTEDGWVHWEDYTTDV